MIDVDDLRSLAEYAKNDCAGPGGTCAQCEGDGCDACDDSGQVPFIIGFADRVIAFCDELVAERGHLARRLLDVLDHPQDATLSVAVEMAAAKLELLS